MRRRELMLLLGGAMTASQDLRAQQKPMPVIGYLPTGRHVRSNSLMAAFRRDSAKLAMSKGKTWGSNSAQLRVGMINCPRWPPISSLAKLT
jgi:hypothetical protein